MNLKDDILTKLKISTEFESALFVKVHFCKMSACLKSAVYTSLFCEADISFSAHNSILVKRELAFFLQKFCVLPIKPNARRMFSFFF